MIRGNPQFKQQSLLSLLKVTENNPQSVLSQRTLEDNIMENLVTIVGYDDSSFSRTSRVGTGLKLTTDGFIITTHHNTQPYEEEWETMNVQNQSSNEENDTSKKYVIIDKNGDSFSIDTSFWAFEPNLGIALIKAMIPEKSVPIRFQPIRRNLVNREEIQLFGLRNQKPFNQLGKVTRESCSSMVSIEGGGLSINRDIFLTDAYGIPEFNGGIFTDFQGQFAGIGIYHPDEGRFGYMGGVKANNVEDFIKKTAQDLYRLSL